MTIWQKIQQIVVGIVWLLVGVLLLAFGKDAYLLVIGMYTLVLAVYGIRLIWYYITMARHMTGGRGILYRGLLALDAGIFAASLAWVPQFYILVYLTGTQGFTGIVDLLRAKEAKGVEGHWKLKAFQGVMEVVIALACLIFLRTPEYVVDIVAIGFVFSAIMRIIGAFRRAAVITID